MTHSPPSPTATSAGPLPTRIVATTRLLSGSIRDTVFAPEVRDPHAALAERNALRAGTDLDRPADLLFVRVSMRGTVPSTESATHAAPSPMAMPDGSMPGTMVFSSRPVDAFTRTTRSRGPTVTHTDPSPKATYSGDSPTCTGLPSTFFESGFTRTSSRPRC